MPGSEFKIVVDGGDWGSPMATPCFAGVCAWRVHTPRSQMTERKSVDWEAIEREYRAGQLSALEIGRQHGVSRQAILKRGATRPYSTMSIAPICAMAVADIAHEDCVLWLWVTNHHLREAFTVLDAWGFEQKTVLTWVKDKLGCGDWLRGQTEHALMAVRGKPTVELSNQTTVLRGPVRGHSQKPEEFFKFVETLYPAPFRNPDEWRRMIIAKNNLEKYDAERAPIAAEQRVAIDDDAERAAIRSDLAAVRAILQGLQSALEEMRSGAPLPKLDDLVKQLDNLTNATNH